MLIMIGLILGGGLLVDYKRSGAFLPGIKKGNTVWTRDTFQSSETALDIDLGHDGCGISCAGPGSAPLVAGLEAFQPGACRR